MEGLFAVCGSQSTAGIAPGSERGPDSATEHLAPVEVRLDLCVESQHSGLCDVAQASEQ